jgi:hypothetical protein
MRTADEIGMRTSFWAWFSVVNLLLFVVCGYAFLIVLTCENDCSGTQFEDVLALLALSAALAAMVGVVAFVLSLIRRRRPRR